MALGLSVRKRIVTEPGGEISFTSEPGKGTELSVVLPASPPAETQPQPAARARPRPPKCGAAECS